MNSYERMMGRIRGEKVDRVPNMNIVMMYAAKEIGLPYGRVVRDGRLMAQSMIRCYERYGIDCLDAISDSVREIEDMGAEVIVPETGVPYLKQAFITGPEDLHKLRLIDPEKGRAMADRIETVRLMKDYAKGEVPVVGWVEGAFAAACNTMGVQQFLYMMIEDPDAARELLSFCYEQETAFALAQVRAGADIVGVGDAAASLIGPNYYREYAFGFEKKMFDEIHAAGAYVKLHICGNTNALLDSLCLTGTDILDIDHMVDFARAGALMRARGCVCGNFDPLNVVLRGTPGDIRNAVRACIDMAPDNVIIAAGCEIPLDTPPENLLAIHEALCEYGA